MSINPVIATASPTIAPAAQPAAQPSPTPLTRAAQTQQNPLGEAIHAAQRFHHHAHPLIAATATPSTGLNTIA